MLRVQSEGGWWLITHPDHAHLAGDFASHWGNSLFSAPQPRPEVLDAIYAHDDGWAARDAHPSITRQGSPAAFSSELVGKYSAFEEIDLADYLSVRESALDQVALRSAYSALLVSMHTHNLLTARADRSTIVQDQLPLLDSFLSRLLDQQHTFRDCIRTQPRLSENEVKDESIEQNFRLLQATDNLSLLSCVAYNQPANLLHPLRTVDGNNLPIKAIPIAPRTFRLNPYPLDQPLLTFTLPARYVQGRSFSSPEDLRAKYTNAPRDLLTVTITA